MTRSRYRPFQKHVDSPPWVKWYKVWRPSRGYGRKVKRQLSKARRRYAKEQLAGRRGKEPTGIEREVNWRGW